MEKNVKVKGKLQIHSKPVMKTYSFRMDKNEYELANAKCSTKYGTSLPSLIRVMIKSHFEIK